MKAIRRTLKLRDLLHSPYLISQDLPQLQLLSPTNTTTKFYSTTAFIQCFDRQRTTSFPLRVSSKTLLFLPTSKQISQHQKSFSNKSLNLNVPTSRYSTTIQMKDWDANLDPVQRKLLEEECILLDTNDKVVGHDSKKNCHLVKPDGDIPLHRAFSAFIFNSKGQLLLQQRSKTKITFPLMWTNSCCSHPLYLPDEMKEAEGLGAKIAAKRRIEIELGTPSNALDVGDFHYLTRIHYKALSNGIWGEHEIDYILFVQKDVELKPNPDEVEAVRYASLEDIRKMVEIDGLKLTPWFELIYKTWLPIWWNNLNSLEKFEDHKQIHRM